MARTIKISIATFVLFALIALSMFSSTYAEKPPVYADVGGLVLSPEILVRVFNWARLPPNTPDLSVYRDFAKRFYKTCSVDVDMVALLIYGIRAYAGPYIIGYALLYDPLTSNLMWAFLNRSDASTFFDWGYQDYYVVSKGFPPMGFYFWYLVIDEYAWRYNHSLVARAWFFRYNATHLKNPYTRYNGFPLDIYCPISDNFTWTMLFKGLPQTVTYTMSIAVTMTYTMPVTITLPVTITETATTTLPPVTITSTTTATSTATIERTVTETATITTPITVEKTVTREKAFTLHVTTTMSYTLTLPVTMTTTATSTIERWLTTTQIAKELDMASLMIASGLAVAIGIAIGFVVRRR